MAKTISYTNNGDGTHTLATTWTGDSTLMGNKLEDLGRDLYALFRTEEDDDWENLTNQEKLDAFLNGLTRLMRNRAHKQYKRDVIKTARDGIDEMDDRYGTE